MTIIQIGRYLVEQVPIELIKTGDTVMDWSRHDLSPSTFVVDVKWCIKPGAGATWGLRAAFDSDTHGVGGEVATIEAPAGTLTHRVVGTTGNA